MEEISQHLEAHLVEVLDRLRLCIRQILRLQEVHDELFDEWPVLGRDILSLRVLQHQEAEQITDCNLALVFGDLGELAQFIDGLPRDVLSIESSFNPGHHVAC